MFSYATKVLMALTVAAPVAAGVYYAAEGGRAGAVLLLMLSLSAFFGMLVVVGAGVRDIAPDVPADAPAPERSAHTVGEAATGSGWPLFAAAALTLLAVGAATNEVVVYAGLIAVVLACFGWFSKAWSDHPTWTTRISSRINERAVEPLGLPIGGTLLAAIIAISVSRILLASDVKVAPWISLVVALGILGACAWAALRPRVSSSVLSAMSVAAFLAMLGVGIAGAAQGEREFHKEHEDEPVEVQAKNSTFEQKRLEATPTHDGTILIEFENRDEDVFHNVAVYTSDKADAAPIFNGQGFPGEDTFEYEFEAPSPGTYSFRCDFHSNMVGTFVVEGG